LPIRSPLLIAAAVGVLVLALAVLLPRLGDGPRLSGVVSQRTEVPDLVGMPLADAQALVSARGIELNVVGERLNDHYPKGTIILQTPVAGWRGGVDGPMRVTVSAGPTAPGPLGTPSSASGAAADVPCAPDAPRFVQGFAELQRQVGDPMGNPLRCEHPDPASGDMVQETSTGLAYYRPYSIKSGSTSHQARFC
jgi:hypothetical protein